MRINTYIVVIVLDSICIESFHYLAGENVLIFGDDMSPSALIDNKNKERNKNILNFGKGQIQGLDDTTLTVEVQQSNKLSKSNSKQEILFKPALYIYIYIYIYQFKGKNVQKIFQNIFQPITQKIGFNGYVYEFSADYRV